MLKMFYVCKQPLVLQCIREQFLKIVLKNCLLEPHFENIYQIEP